MAGISTEKRETGLVINVSTEGMDEAKAELKELRSLAARTNAALKKAKGAAKGLSLVTNRECPTRDDVVIALRRFVVRVAGDQRASDAELDAMAEIATTCAFVECGIDEPDGTAQRVPHEAPDGNFDELREMFRGVKMEADAAQSSSCKDRS